MKKKQLAALILGVILCMAAAMPAAAAARVDAVYLSLISENELYSLTPGESIVYTTPMESGGGYYIDDTNITQSSSNGVVVYTLEVRAADGWYFDNNTMVSVYGAYEIAVSVRTSTRLRVTARAYPYRVLDQVSDVTIDPSAKVATWSPIEGVRNYSVIISYTDQNGNYHRAEKSSSGPRIDLKSYLDRYDYVDVAVRPTKASTTRDRFAAEPNYINTSGGVDNESYVDFYDFRLPTAVYGNLPDGSTGRNPFDTNASSSGSSGSSGSIPGSSPQQPPAGSGPLSGGSTGSGSQGGSPAGSGTAYSGWQGSGDNWYYLVNGIRSTGWISITPDEWYFLDNNGLMCAGWFNDGGDVFLLNPSHDGSYGKMLTGYQACDGYLYYFNQTHDGTFGAMYKNRYTPDGRWADERGIVR